MRLLAAILLLTGLGPIGCRAKKPEPEGINPKTGVEQGAALGISAPEAKGEARSPALATKPRETQPERPVARWALWPMPNFAASGLPNPESYDASVPGTVRDLVTGLMWQKVVDPGNVSFDDANDRCDRLDLAGYHDWRLPSRIELVSIIDLAEGQPAIDRSAFPGTPSEWFWTSSPSAASPTDAWYVYFYFGYPKTDARRSHFRARCVRTDRAPAFAGSPDTHYELAAATVRDLGTGLTWQRELPTRTFAFDAAQAYCAHLALDGHKDWRVPSMPELVTLVDERASNPAIDTTAFPGTPSESFWTSSGFGNKSAEAWHVYFDYGSALYGLHKGAYRVRCVR
ncbi:MAG: DUF1566 domain-containing protein [Polyangiaceae bacterium]